MKKKVLCLLILFISFILVGCQDARDKEEIERIGNLINGT